MCLVTQAFFSGVEMVMLSCNRLKLRHLSESGNRLAKVAVDFLDEPQKFLAATMVGVNLPIVAGSAVAASLAVEWVSNDLVAIVSAAIMWPLILIFGEIVPMSLARQYADRLVLVTIFPLKVSYFAMLPIVAIVTSISNLIAKIVGVDVKNKSPFVTRDEIQILVREGERHGALHRDERRMIHHIFHFGELRTREIMVPLIDIVAVSVAENVGHTAKLMIQTGHSRIPVYRDRVDNVVGMVHAVDLIGLDENAPVQEVMDDVYIVPETKSAEEVLADLRANGKHMGTVVDEYGGISGIVTLEDIVEEVVGEIEDEYDRSSGIELTRDAVVVEGRMEIDELNEKLGLKIEKEDYETIGGMLISFFGRIPKVGETMSQEGVWFRVVNATDRRVLKVEVRREK